MCVNDTTTCWQTVGDKYRTCLYSCQLFANSLPTYCRVVHTHQLEFANTSWPKLVWHVKAALFCVAKISFFYLSKCYTKRLKPTRNKTLILLHTALKEPNFFQFFLTRTEKLITRSSSILNDFFAAISHDLIFICYSTFYFIINSFSRSSFKTPCVILLSMMMKSCLIKIGKVLPEENNNQFLESLV